VTAFFDTFLLVCAALLPVVNPVGGAPIFLGLTEGDTAIQRKALSWKIALNSFLLLFGAMVVGSYVLSFFGLSLPVVRIAGGLLLTGLGWKLLNADPSPDHVAAKSAPVDPDSFYPLTMPLTVGPGCMAIAITLGAQAAQLHGMDALVLFRAASTTGLLAISISIWLCYRFAEPLVRALGHGGTTVVVRLSAFILVCIGLQIIWNGWNELHHLHR
jgi:multiple antibiotic resistance protein